MCSRPGERNRPAVRPRGRNRAAKAGYAISSPARCLTPAGRRDKIPWEAFETVGYFPSGARSRVSGRWCKSIAAPQL